MICVHAAHHRAGPLRTPNLGIFIHPPLLAHAYCSHARGKVYEGCYLKQHSDLLSYPCDLCVLHTHFFFGAFFFLASSRSFRFDPLVSESFTNLAATGFAAAGFDAPGFAAAGFATAGLVAAGFNPKFTWLTQSYSTAAISSQQTAVNGELLALSSQLSAVNAQQSTVNSQRSIVRVNSQQSSVNS